MEELWWRVEFERERPAEDVLVVGRRGVCCCVAEELVLEKGVRL